MANIASIDHLDHTQNIVATSLDWPRIAYLTLLSRAIDDLEETELLKNREILYQFSARGHDVAQIILASLLDHPGDAASGYYRSRPLLLALGLEAAALKIPVSKGPFPSRRSLALSPALRVALLKLFFIWNFEIKQP